MKDTHSIRMPVFVSVFGYFAAWITGKPSEVIAGYYLAAMILVVLG